jgi:hypothetical protein
VDEWREKTIWERTAYLAFDDDKAMDSTLFD